MAVHCLIVWGLDGRRIRVARTYSDASLLADDFHQDPLAPSAIELAVEDLLPGTEVELDLVTATTTSRPMICRFMWASALSSPVRLCW